MIGIIGAMEEEVQALRHAMKIQEEKEIASMVFHRGILYGKEAVVVRSGIGKVNAAICTQILADHFDVDLVINTGIAGSLDAAIDIGDMVISTDAVQHDMDTSIFGDPIGQVPRMDTFAFPADAQLVEKAVRYPKDKTDITQYIYEPWHYRYVGEEAAKAIMEKGITLEEYLAQIQK